MVELLYDVLENTSIAISVIPLIFLLFICKRAEASEARLFFILLLLELISEISSRILTWNNCNNFFIWHIHAVLYSVLLQFIYKDYLQSLKGLLKLMIPTIIVCITGLLEAFIDQGYLRANTITYLLLCAQAILFSLMSFNSLINDRRIKDFTLSSVFWINSGVLFFFGTTFCLILFEGYIIKVNPQLLYYTWSIQLVANIIFHLVLARGIWLMRRT